MSAPPIRAGGVAAFVRRADHFRWQTLVRAPDARAFLAFKEWQHFIVHTPELMLLVNLNLSRERWTERADPRGVARLLVMACTDRWTGSVDRFAPEEVSIPAGGVTATLGGNRLSFEAGAWRLSAGLRDGSVSVDLRLVPDSEPMLSTNRELAPSRRLSWFVMPRLRATGRVALDGRVRELVDAPAYHDHNWGSFFWGDDFSWEWASFLPLDPTRPWSLVYARVLDRARHLVRSAGLYLFKDGAQHRYFRDHQVEVAAAGCLRQTDTLVIPAVMRLLADTEADDIPARVQIRGRDGDDELRLEFATQDYARVAVPNETDLSGITVLTEASGRAVLRGTVRGEAVEMEAASSFELIRT